MVRDLAAPIFYLCWLGIWRLPSHSSPCRVKETGKYTVLDGEPLQLRGTESRAPRQVGVMIRILNGKTDMREVDVSKEHLKNLALTWMRLLRLCWKVARVVDVCPCFILHDSFLDEYSYSTRNSSSSKRGSSSSSSSSSSSKGSR